ncbi:unnamed protein product, partial [Allacma fusca]
MTPARIIGLLLTVFLSSATAVEELILTPLIREVNLAQAKERATDNINLSHIKSSLNKPMTSYSGYLTVNEAYNSNLFFWLFPAIENPDTSSVILITNSVPGVSLMQGIFLENGPFVLDDNLELKEQNYTWAKTHTLIYIDTPVGTGFSYTDKEDGFASSAQDEDEELYEAMKQIYTLFPEYQSSMVNRIYSPEIYISLDLVTQLDDALHQVGLIDENQSEMLAVEEKKLDELIDNKNTDASEQMLKINFAPGR